MWTCPQGNPANTDEIFKKYLGGCSYFSLGWNCPAIFKISLPRGCGEIPKKDLQCFYTVWVSSVAHRCWWRRAIHLGLWGLWRLLNMVFLLWPQGVWSWKPARFWIGKPIGSMDPSPTTKFQMHFRNPRGTECVWQLVNIWRPRWM